MIAPSKYPPITSESQWTLRYSLVNPISKIISIDAVMTKVFWALFFRYLIEKKIRDPNNTIEIVECPLGNENPASENNAFIGLCLWNISLDNWISVPVIKVVIIKNFAFLSSDFKYSAIEIIILAIIIHSGFRIVPRIIDKSFI
jgi:hypothetical protein